MNRTLVVAKKELRTALNSPAAYVFFALFALASWFLFFHFEKFFAVGEASARGLFRWMPWLLLALAPPLTMRMWADEKRLGTWEVLATTPVSSEALVVGKFLAAFALLVLGLVLTTSLPAVAASYGDLDMGPVLGGYLGAALLGAAFLALGLVCSSLVQDQFVALILGWVLGAATMFPGMPFWEGLVGRGAADALRRFGFGTRYESIARGLVDFRDVLFYVTVVSFLLVLNTTLVRARRFTA